MGLFITTIAGSRYALNTVTDEKEMKKIAAAVNDSVMEIKKDNPGVSMTQITTLAFLNFMHEFYAMERQKNEALELLRKADPEAAAQFEARLKEAAATASDDESNEEVGDASNKADGSVEASSAKAAETVKTSAHADAAGSTDAAAANVREATLTADQDKATASQEEAPETTAASSADEEVYSHDMSSVWVPTKRGTPVKPQTKTHRPSMSIDPITGRARPVRTSGKSQTRLGEGLLNKEDEGDKSQLSHPYAGRSSRSVSIDPITGKPRRVQMSKGGKVDPLKPRSYQVEPLVTAADANSKPVPQTVSVSIHGDKDPNKEPSTTGSGTVFNSCLVADVRRPNEVAGQVVGKPTANLGRAAAMAAQQNEGPVDQASNDEVEKVSAPVISSAEAAANVAAPGASLASSVTTGDEAADDGGEKKDQERDAAPAQKASTKPARRDSFVPHDGKPHKTDPHVSHRKKAQEEKKVSTAPVVFGSSMKNDRRPSDTSGGKANGGTSINPFTGKARKNSGSVNPFDRSAATKEKIPLGGGATLAGMPVSSDEAKASPSPSKAAPSAPTSAPKAAPTIGPFAAGGRAGDGATKNEVPSELSDLPLFNGGTIDGSFIRRNQRGGKTLEGQFAPEVSMHPAPVPGLFPGEFDVQNEKKGPTTRNSAGEAKKGKRINPFK